MQTLRDIRFSKDKVNTLVCMRTMMKPIFQSQPTKMMRLLANRIIIRYSSPFWGVGVGNLAQVNVVQEIVHRHPVSVGEKGSILYKIESPG